MDTEFSNKVKINTYFSSFNKKTEKYNSFIMQKNKVSEQNKLKCIRNL